MLCPIKSAASPSLFFLGAKRLLIGWLVAYLDADALVDRQFSAFHFGKYGGGDFLEGLFDFCVVFGVDFNEDEAVFQGHLLAFLIGHHTFFFQVVLVPHQ